MPDLSRRSFLTGSSAAAGGLVLAGCTGPAPAPDPSFDPADWTSVRAQFPLRGDVAPFSAFVFAAHPRPVADAIARHRAGLDEDTHGYLVATEATAESAVRSAAAGYLGARPDEIALTDSTTMGLGLLYSGLRLRPDQEVLTTEHDFYSTHQALQLRADRDGAPVRRVRLYDDPAAGSVDQIVGRLLAGVSPATRVVAVTWVHSGTGVKLPVRAIADALAARNAARAPQDRALLCVDGVHGLGVEDASVTDLGCDFLVAGTHKWLWGPRGTGIVWGRADAWASVDAMIPAFRAPNFAEWVAGAPRPPMSGVSFTPGGYHSFEHRWALAEAFGFHLDIGRDRVAERTRTQASRLKQGLVSVDGLRLVTPAAAELSSGIVCFDVAGTRPQAVVDRLATGGIAATVTPYREQHVRVGPSIVTSDDDVEALINALRS